MEFPGMAGIKLDVRPTKIWKNGKLDASSVSGRMIGIRFAFIDPYLFSLIL